MKLQTLAVLAVIVIPGVLLTIAWPHRATAPVTAESLAPSAPAVPARTANAKETAATADTQGTAETNKTRPREEVDKTLAEIQDATEQYSESELPKFARWLKSPTPEIRAAAADGLMQSDLPGAPALLRDAAAASKDPEESARLMEAAATLDLPPATERLVKAINDSKAAAAPGHP